MIFVLNVRMFFDPSLTDRFKGRGAVLCAIMTNPRSHNEKVIMTFEARAKSMILSLTGSESLVWTSRGNSSIRMALKLAASQGRKKVVLLDQGGWMTYPQYVVRLGLEMIELRSDFGLIKGDELISRLSSRLGPEDEFSGCVLLINSMPSYAFYQDMSEISRVCKENDIFLINDVTGSIGTPQATFGDLVLGSFGKEKPIPLGLGGFIASRDLLESEEQADLPFDELLTLLESLSSRQERIRILVKEVKEDIPVGLLIHPEQEGFNVIARFSTEDEKEKLINIAKDLEVEYTFCPRYIRVQTDAISFEVKRKFGGVNKHGVKRT